MFEGGDFSLELIKSPDDPARDNDPGFRAELSTFSNALRNANIQFSQLEMMFKSVGAEGFPLPELILAAKALASSPAVTVLGGVLATWLGARYGRKVRLKIGDIEAEARTQKKLDELLEKAARFLRDDNDRG